jgi:uncharacterized surface protein with fasciclin (FAS1) repeats
MICIVFGCIRILGQTPFAKTYPRKWMRGVKLSPHQHLRDRDLGWGKCVENLLPLFGNHTLSCLELEWNVLYGVSLTMLKLLLFFWLLIVAIIGGLVLLFFGLVGISSTSTSVMPEPFSAEAMPIVTPSLVDTLAADGRFGILVTALKTTQLDITLANGGPYTVFAPTDDAFNALPSGTVDALLEDPDTLSDMLLFHVLAGTLTSDDIAQQEELISLQGGSIIVRAEDGRIFVNQAEIIITDMVASNGMIHVIDAVMIPDETGE